MLMMERFFENYQRYGKGAQRMLGHDWLVRGEGLGLGLCGGGQAPSPHAQIQCGAGMLANPGFLSVARFQNVTDLYQYMTLGRTQSLYQALADYGTESERWSGPFAFGAHFWCMPRDDWYKMRNNVILDDDDTLKNMTYYLFKNFWSPMAWCIRTQNPESPTQLTACQANLVENQNMAYTGVDLENPEQSPVWAIETQQAIEMLKRSEMVRLLDKDETLSIRHNIKDSEGRNENWFHLGRILNGIGETMNALSPVKQLGIQYILKRLGIGGAAGKAIGDAASNLYDKAAAGLSNA